MKERKEPGYMSAKARKVYDELPNHKWDDGGFLDEEGNPLEVDQKRDNFWSRIRQIFLRKTIS